MHGWVGECLDDSPMLADACVLITVTTCMGNSGQRRGGRGVGSDQQAARGGAGKA